MGHPEAAARAWHGWREKVRRAPLVNVEIHVNEVPSAEELMELLAANARPMFDLAALRESFEKSKRLMDG